MSKEFYEQAYEEEYVQVEPSSEEEAVEDNQQEEVTEQSEQEEVVTDTEQEEVKDEVATEIPSEIDIDGEKITLDQIKEWKLGNMRQSDYTRKTQELAQQRKQMQEAVELYEYIKSNPDVATALRESDYSSNIEKYTDKLTPEMQRVQELEYKLAEKELNDSIKTLQEKYPDFNDVEVLTECDKRGIYDLEFVYKALHADKQEEIDVEKIKQEAIEEAKKQLMEEIQKNKDTTTTIISSEKGSEANPSPADMLTDEEKAYCDKRGFNYEEYVKWRG